MEIESLSSLQATLPLDGWRRLKAFLGTVDKGSDVNLVTPFLPNEWRSNELDYGAWYAKNIAYSSIDEFNELEDDEAKKFGPFSIRLPYADRKEGVLEYFQQETVPGPPLMRSFDRMSRWIPKHSVAPIDFTAAYGAMPKDSNLGLPWFTRQKEFSRDYLRRAQELKAGGYKQSMYPSVLGWRGQPNGTSSPKQRVVWMMDHIDTVVGLSIQVPLLEKLRSRFEFAAWNEVSNIDRAVTALIDSARSPILSIDFSGFDKTLPRVLIHLAFELLRYWFVDKAKHQIDWLEDSLLTVGLVTPEGVMHGRLGGMTSGTALTNAVDSLCQLLLMFSFADSGTVLGDDGVYSSKVGFNLEELSNQIFSAFGMKISDSKGSLNINAVSYLQKLHLRKYRVHGICVGVRSLTRMWNGVCHQERGHSDLPPEFFSARAIMQLENCKWHPRFETAVAYFYS